MTHKSAEWESQLRRGVFANLGYYRSRLLDQQAGGKPLDALECDAAVDMLNALEDFMRVAWRPGQVELTKRATEKIRPLDALGGPLG